MHHKRRRPKNRRAGCLLCKPRKANGAKGRAASLRLGDRRALLSAREQRDGVHEFTKGLAG